MGPLMCLQYLMSLVIKDHGSYGPWSQTCPTQACIRGRQPSDRLLHASSDGLLQMHDAGMITIAAAM